MGTYPAGPPPGPVGLQTVCFTAGTATAMRGALVGVGAMGWALVGAVVGFIVSLVTGPEVVTKVVGIVVGAIIGGVLGAAYVGVIVAGAGCPCPAGATAFCISFVVLIIGSYALPVPPFIVPAPPGACATLVPPTCVP